MNWIATAEECREMDRQAEAMGVSVESLMHEAGRAVAACVIERFPEARRIVVICGKGNNGGDGLVAARLLAERALHVEVVIAAGRDELTVHARRECDRLKEVGVEPRCWNGDSSPSFEADLVIDAILGTGLTGAPTGPAASAIQAVHESGLPVVSVDIPSGVECDSGAALGVAVRASVTVTFGLAKPFLFQGPGLDLAGDWVLHPIGFPSDILDKDRSARLFELADAKKLMPTRGRNAHKGSEGHVLILAGSDKMPGAAVLCAYAALRAGAGLATVASTTSVCQAASVHLPEVILMPLPDEDGRLSVAAANSLLENLPKADAAVFGPGLGDSPNVRHFLEAVWKAMNIPMAIDADALRADIALTGDSVLTPHPGEAAGLMETTSAEIQAHRFASVKHLAERTGKTVLLKGAYTLVQSGQDPLSVNPTGNSGMAAPGMGDVLSGIVGALLAKGLPSADAARLAAYWQGLAGDLCAQEIGPAGYLASEVADMLPKARATIASA